MPRQDRETTTGSPRSPVRLQLRSAFGRCSSRERQRRQPFGRWCRARGLSPPTAFAARGRKNACRKIGTTRAASPPVAEWGSSRCWRRGSHGRPEIPSIERKAAVSPAYFPRSFPGQDRIGPPPPGRRTFGPREQSFPAGVYPDGQVPPRQRQAPAKTSSSKSQRTTGS